MSSIPDLFIRMYNLKSSVFAIFCVNKISGSFVSLKCGKKFAVIVHCLGSQLNASNPVLGVVIDV